MLRVRRRAPEAAKAAWVTHRPSRTPSAVPKLVTITLPVTIPPEITAEPIT
jgi:hypothetical protein